MEKKITVRVTLTPDMLEAITAYAHAIEAVPPLSNPAIRTDILNDIRKNCEPALDALLQELWSVSEPALKQHERSARLLSTKGSSCVQIGQENAAWAAGLLTAAT